MFGKCVLSSMRWGVVLAVVFVFSCAGVVNAEGERYVNEKDHYSFGVPEGWEKMSTEKARTFSEGIEEDVDMEVGFYNGDSDISVFPLFLVAKHRGNVITFDSMIKDMKAVDISSAGGSFESVTSSGGTKIGKTFFDRERKMFFLNAEENLDGDDNLKIFSVIVVGKESVVQLLFFSFASEYEANLEVFNDVVDSFGFEEGYEYDEGAAKMNEIMGYVKEWGPYVGIALVAVGINLYRKFKRKKKEGGGEKSVKESGDADGGMGGGEMKG